MRTALNACTQHGEYSGVLTGKKPNRERTGCTCSQRCDRGPIHHRKRPAICVIKKRDESLMRGQAAAVVAREYRNQLDEHPTAWHITRHCRQQASRTGCRNAWRHRRLPCGELAEGISQRVDQCIDVEKSLDIRLGN